MFYLKRNGDNRGGRIRKERVEGETCKMRESMMCPRTGYYIWSKGF
jgi:hypothetical protein